MAGEKEAGIAGGVLVAIMLAIYISGLVAFFYLKTRRPPDKYEGFIKILRRESFIAFKVTLVMSISSGIGAIFWHVYFPDFFSWMNYIQPFMLSFFIEALLALIWLSYIYLWKTTRTWLRTLVAWIGLFIIFTVALMFNNVIFSSGFWSEAYGYIFSHQFISHLNQYFYSIYADIYFMILNPDMIIDYYITIFKSTGGNQFLLVSEFPKWSFLLVGIAFIGVSIQSLTQLFSPSNQ